MKERNAAAKTECTLALSNSTLANEQVWQVIAFLQSLDMRPSREATERSL